MKTRVQKWGNSLALRVPKSFAAELAWAEGSPVEMTVDGGALSVRTDTERTWELADLLDKVTDENVHPAWETEHI